VSHLNPKESLLVTIHHPPTVAVRNSWVPSVDPLPFRIGVISESDWGEGGGRRSEGERGGERWATAVVYGGGGVAVASGDRLVLTVALRGSASMRISGV
jgi:hypothetical protein